MKIVVFEALLISYPEIKLSENFEVYFNSVLTSNKALRAGIKMTSYKQSFEINVGSQSLVVKLKKVITYLSNYLNQSHCTTSFYP